MTEYDSDDLREIYERLMEQFEAGLRDVEPLIQYHPDADDIVVLVETGGGEVLDNDLLDEELREYAAAGGYLGELERMWYE